MKFLLAICAIAIAHAQGRSQAEWLTSGADAQRSHSIPTDPKISVEAFAQLATQLRAHLLELQLQNGRELGGIQLVEASVSHGKLRFLDHVKLTVSEAGGQRVLVAALRLSLSTFGYAITFRR